SRPRRGEQPITEEDLERQELTKIRGVGEKLAEQLHQAGYTRPRYLSYEDNAERMARLAGLDLKRCKQLLALASKWYEQQNYPADEAEEHQEERGEFLSLIDDRYQTLISQASAN
ncbi:MAG: hypothetical protein KGO50_19010, partial [Myxococcales bacterium]|nr:hypothetical protein [Myxococcales bacterium]